MIIFLMSIHFLMNFRISKKNLKFFNFSLYNRIFFVIMVKVLFGGLERAPTFLVPIINPPFADNSPHSC